MVQGHQAGKDWGADRFSACLSGVCARFLAGLVKNGKNTVVCLPRRMPRVNLPNLQMLDQSWSRSEGCRSGQPRLKNSVLHQSLHDFTFTLHLALFPWPRPVDHKNYVSDNAPEFSIFNPYFLFFIFPYGWNYIFPPFLVIWNVLERICRAGDGSVTHAHQTEFATKWFSTDFGKNILLLPYFRLFLVIRKKIQWKTLSSLRLLVSFVFLMK